MFGMIKAEHLSLAGDFGLHNIAYDGWRSSNMEFWWIQKSYIELGFASSDITFLHPSKLHIGLPTIHHLYNIMQAKVPSQWHVSLHIMWYYVIKPYRILKTSYRILKMSCRMVQYSYPIRMIHQNLHPIKIKPTEGLPEVHQCIPRIHRCWSSWKSNNV